MRSCQSRAIEAHCYLVNSDKNHEDHIFYISDHHGCTESLSGNLVWRSLSMHFLVRYFLGTIAILIGRFFSGDRHFCTQLAVYVLVAVDVRCYPCTFFVSFFGRSWFWSGRADIFFAAAIAAFARSLACTFLKRSMSVDAIFILHFFSMMVSQKEGEAKLTTAAIRQVYSFWIFSYIPIVVGNITKNREKFCLASRIEALLLNVFLSFSKWRLNSSEMRGTLRLTSSWQGFELWEI